MNNFISELVALCKKHKVVMEAQASANDIMETQASANDDYNLSSWIEVYEIIEKEDGSKGLKYLLEFERVGFSGLEG